MHKRTLKVALLVTLAIIMVLSVASVALAATWKDLPSTVTGKYSELKRAACFSAITFNLPCST